MDKSLKFGHNYNILICGREENYYSTIEVEYFLWFIDELELDSGKGAEFLEPVLKWGTSGCQAMI